MAFPEPILVIGEGETEYFYIESLKSVFPEKLQNTAPKLPKHSSLEEMEKLIDRNKDMYAHIFCLIDMDNKADGKEAAKYSEFKRKYSKPYKRDRHSCKIHVIETERCTELFFLFYFRYTTRRFNSCDEIISEIRKHVPYEKKTEFFRKHRLHGHFSLNKGDLKLAVENARRSVRSMETDNRMYTYSNMFEFFDHLG